MNEAETRAEYIDPALAASGWGVVEGSRIRREYAITPGRLEGLGRRGKGLTADYVLIYRNTKLATVEAKAWDEPLTTGVGQAKNYAQKLEIRFAYATNGQGIYGIDMKTGTECEMPQYPTPDQLWAMTFAEANAWCDRFTAIPFEDKGGSHPSRYYQDIAVERVLEAIAADKQRILLTLATGTGKTFIAFQIAWKLFHSRWNLSREPSRRPRILFLADRNILANQAFNAFSAFPEDALVRIDPESIRKKGKVPKNGSIFFTIFQTFMASASSATGLSTGSEYSVSELVELPEIAEPNEGAGGYMYILGCGDGSFYTGSTTDLRLRLQQHRIGEGAKHTSARLPVSLIYWEPFNRIDKAFAREKQVQNWSRAKKIALIKGDVALLKRLSKSRSVPEPVEGYFGDYPPDFFDFIVIDECHRGGANDESNWRAILDYFAPAVQLGLTATPKRKDNVDTYAYFGEPVYIYSLMEMLFGRLPEFFKDEAELRSLWCEPATRKKLLEGLTEKGFGREQLTEMQRMIDAEKSDLFDVLAHVAYALTPLSREERAAMARIQIMTHFNDKQQAFLDFVLAHYVSVGVEELDQEKLTPLLRLKYDSISDAIADLGGKADEIGKVFAGFQKYLYDKRVVA